MRNDERLRTIYEVMAPYIVRSERNWRDYLAFASRFHKQSFDNILLVYAQDEDVTILASKKQWASVGRNLISRPKGIAVCVYSNARLTLDYLFDISQTVGREIHPTNWRLSDEMQKALGERLTFSHGFQAQPFPDLLYALARESVNDNYEHYLQGLRQETKNHLFEEIPAGGFEAQYIQLLTDSVSYFIGKKCHLPDDAIRTSDGMATVNHFNTVPLVAHLGMAVTSISKAVLLEMERNIRIINRERKVQYEQAEHQSELQRTGRDASPRPANLQQQRGGQAPGPVRADGAGTVSYTHLDVYKRQGQDVVDMNHKAIDAGATAFKKFTVPASWKDAQDAPKESVLSGPAKLVKMVENILEPVDRMDGDSLPVSAFVDHADGTFEQGASAYEKRGVAVSVPEWDSSKCIQCNQCAYVCPHATIRPYALTEEEAKNAPDAAKIVDVKAGKGKGVYKFAMAVSPLDCMGCSVCAHICPTNALTMVSQESQAAQQEVFDYMVASVSVKEDMADLTVKGSQFRTPLLEFSGSCAGCAETAYARLITQLFGDRMYISNATGCSSIWGGPAATSPYCTNKEGHGPAWANSLFEDNAEHGLGMYLGQQATRSRLADLTRELIAKDWAVPALKEAGQKWLDTMEDSAANGEATKAYIAALESSICTVDELLANPKAEIHAFGEELKAKGETLCQCDACKLAAEILADKEFLSKKSMWIFGGDGWAYDIGFGGLDHVLASGNDVNVFVFDTEVYSNTGGQASKASNIGQVAQFAAAGKEIKKKSLAEIAMSYGYIYVAQVAMGANPAQTLKAIQEAEAYPGPSLIIGYAPCEMHSIKGGMMNCQKEMKKAVECGYWNLFRFNPAAEGAKFTLDSKEPAGGYQEFLMNEARYSRLTREFPDRAGELFQRNEKAAMDRYQHLLKLKAMYSE